MRRRTILMLVSALVVLGSLVGGRSAAGAGVPTEVFDCGANKVTVWVLPLGVPKGFIPPGFEKETIPGIDAFNGWGRRTLETRAASTHFGVAGVAFGGKCVPKGYLRAQLQRAPFARVTVPARLRCAFPSRPHFRIVMLANGDNRLELILSSKTIVASARVTPETAHMDYAKRYCTMTKVSIRAR